MTRLHLHLSTIPTVNRPNGHPHVVPHHPTTQPPNYPTTKLPNYPTTKLANHQTLPEAAS